MKKMILPLACSMLLSTNVIAENNYLCITDEVTGFNHDAGMDAWKHTSFVAGQRYRITEIQPNLYQAQKVDEQSPWSAACTPRRDQTDDSFSCENRTTELHFNRKELRFTLFRYFGYWNGSRDSLSMSIGKCFLD
jgi:hypothetical protein